MSEHTTRKASIVAMCVVVVLLLAMVASTAMAAGTFYWTTVMDRTDGNLNALTATSVDNLWAVASGTPSTILSTTNASAASPDWTPVTIPGVYVSGLFALDNTHIWASGGNAGDPAPNTSAIFCWSGSAWVSQNAGATAYQLNGGTAESGTQAWVCGNDRTGVNPNYVYHGKILWSNGGAYNSGTSGTAWVDDFTDPTTNGCYIKSMSNAGGSVWAVGYENTSNDGKIFKRTGPGAWTLQKTVTGWRLYAVKALDDMHAWAAGRNGTVLYTSDGGTNWLTATTPGTSDLQSITATDMTHVWAGGSGGAIYTLNGTTWRADTIPLGTDSVKGAAVGDANTVYLGSGSNARNRVFRGTAQAIASCNPTMGLQGQTLGVAIVGTGTHFANGTSNATFTGTGITVNSTTVTDPTHATANITIAAGATPGARDVNVLTGTEAPTPLAAAFLVKAVHTIAASAGPGGTIAPSGAVKVTDGNSQLYIITPNAGMHVADVKVDGVSMGGITDYYFGNVTADHTIAATFSDQWSTWFLPEGSTAWGFSSVINIENPNPQDLNARVTYMKKDGTTKEQMVGLPKMSKVTVSPLDTIGATDFSTKVECVQGKTIAVDRSMYWQIDGSQAAATTNSIGVTAPSNEWFLPEGSSNWGFTTWLLMQNPSDVEANVTVVYMIEGVGPKPIAHVIPAHSRASFNMVDEIGKADASMLVVSNVGVIPERAVYTSALDANGQTMKREGHDSVGVTRPANDFYLAEGSTAWGFTTYVLVQNPNAVTANVTLTYMTAQGPIPSVKFAMPANSRKTIRVNDKYPGFDLSTKVHADVPIVAERSMFWAADGVGGLATHDSIGTSAAHGIWYLPDGQTGVDDGGTETYTLVQNPNNAPVQVRISYLSLGGTNNVVFTDTVAANSRKTYNMADKYPGAEVSASIMVESLTEGKNVIVERSIYGNARWGGSDSLGGFSD